MGIRLECRNGHKLHVKSFLAGKRGICPKCGVKILIPNDLESDKAIRLRSAVRVVPAGSEKPVDRRALAPTLRPDVPKNGPPGGAPLGVARPAESLANPIDEAPHSVWYVRPASGIQYGPASGEVLRGWIAEGRVTPSCHVWREGWEDWQSAAVLLRSERARAVEVAAQAVLPGPPPASPAPDTHGPGAPGAHATVLVQIDTVVRRNARKRRRKRAVLLMWMLLLVCMVLLVPLYLVTLGR